MTFEIKRMVKTIIRVDGQEMTVSEPVWFEIHVNLDTAEAWFVGANKTPYAISAEMLEVLKESA
jgi:hypothetical protein|tara:strand:+ start:1571 stop:1762 length:192 start_codon:yes stop_codon:yes gene_type:complete